MQLSLADFPKTIYKWNGCLYSVNHKTAIIYIYKKFGET